LSRSTVDLVEIARRAIAAHKPFAVCTLVRGARNVGAKMVVHADGVEGSQGEPSLDEKTAAEARRLLAGGESQTLTIEDSDVFFDLCLPEPRLIIVGAVHIAVALCEMAVIAGFSVTIVDPRPALNVAERFPRASQRLVGWPEDELPALEFDENTYVAVLTHDEKFDDPTVLHALRTPARYIGAIGSKKTQALRRERLRDAGVSVDAIERLRGPIGLDIGAQSPEEIAVAILSEMIAAKHLRAGRPLRDRLEPHIHD